MNNISAQLQYDHVRTVDPFLWALDNELKLQGGAFSLLNHEYQVDILSCDAKRQVAKKGAQLGLTEVNVIRSLHGMIHNKYPQGVLYLFPTSGDVIDFSKGRFAPLIEDNNFIKRYVKDTDAANIKRVGSAMLYLRGARSSQKIEGVKKTSSKLKTIPVDKIVFDERDEMDAEMVQLALERFSHSEVQEEFHLSTPTIPDYGVDRMYNESDQRVWEIKCDKCRKYTCLELEFPECLGERADGKIFRKCMHCHSEIHPCNGRWTAQYPERSKDLVGWWISQLCSTYVEPGEILHQFNNPPNGKKAEIYNSKLGMAYIDAENRLQRADVYNCCGQDAMEARHHGPCAMGVDVGKVLHVVVGYKVSDLTNKIIFMTRAQSFSDLHDIAKRFNVKSTVIDLYPETRKCREFQDSQSHQVVLCEYRESAGQPIYTTDGVVKYHRTEICDTTHQRVIDRGALEIPRRCAEVDEFAEELCNTARVLSEDNETGVTAYRYRKLGADHYRHALNYLEIALQDMSIADPARTTGDRYRRQTLSPMAM